jgi:PhnB protein
LDREKGEGSMGGEQVVPERRGIDVEVLATPRRAEDAGATVFEPAQDAFWEVRRVQVLDPWGQRWAFDQHVRDVSDSEVERDLAFNVGGA